MSYINPRLDPGEMNVNEMQGIWLAFDITKSVETYLAAHPGSSLTPAHYLAFAQRSWKLNPEHANEAGHILAVVRTPDKRRRIVGVFVRGREGNDHFFPSPETADNERRYNVLLEPAEEGIRNSLTGLYLPARKPGQANPIEYFTQD